MYLKHRVKGEPKSVGVGFIVALVCFLLGMMSKSTAMVFPLMLVFFDVVFPDIARRTTLGRRVQEHVVMFAALLVLMVLNVKLAARETMFAAPFGGGTASHLMTIIQAIPFYMRQILWPDALSVIYEAPLPRSFAEPAVIVSVLIMVAIFALMITGRRRLSVTVFGIGWFMLALGPTLNIVPFGTFAADRYAYLALFGLCLVAGAAMSGIWLRGGVSRAAATAAALAISLACLFASIHKNEDWKDQVTFWSATRKTTPKSADAAVGLAMSYMSLKQYDKALLELKQALKLNPDSGSVYTGLALYYLTMKDLSLAEETIRIGMKHDPFSVKLHFHYGILQYEKGDYMSAVKVFAIVKKEKPSFSGVDGYLFKSLMKLRPGMTQKEFMEFVNSL